MSHNASPSVLSTSNTGGRAKAPRAPVKAERQLKLWFIAAIVALFAACLGYATALLLEEAKTVRLASRSGTWIAAQVEIEYLRFRNALDRFAGATPGTTQDDVIQRFEIFWSRLPLVLEGREGSILRQAPGATEAIREIVTALEAVEPVLLDLRHGDREVLAELLAVLEPLELKIHDFARETILDLQGRVEKERMHRALIAILIFLTGALASGALLIALLFRELRRARRFMEGEQLARLKAEQADRSKSQFLANTSHELRTPLNAIIGFSELMRCGTFGPIGHTRYREYIQDIHASSCHLLDVINGILDLSRIEASKIELDESEIPISDIVDRTCRMVLPRAMESGVELRQRIEPDAPRLIGDPRLLKQAIVNIVGNAVKFTRPGGYVDVSLVQGTDGALGFAVEDTGIGMTGGELIIALQPFGQVDQRLERRYQGTGLGLPLAKSFIELHGGRLDIASKPGEGTKVVLWIPGNRIVGAESRLA